MAEALYQVGWNQLVAILMGAIVWLLCRTPPLSRRPALCHGLWLLVLLKLVTLPIVPVPLPPILAAEEPNDIATPPTTEPLVGETNNNRAVTSTETTTIGHSTTFVNQANLSAACCPEPIVAETAEPPPSADPPGQTQPVPWRTAMIIVLGISVLITGLLWSIAARRIYRVRRLLESGAVESGHAAELLREISRRFHLRAAIRLRVVDAPVAPMLWAMPGRPAIVLPRGLMNSLSDDQLRNILAHELAHYIRRDHWTSLFALLVASLLWWNPIGWIARRQLATAAEASCDAMALERLGSRKSYAETLLTVIDSLTATPPPRSALGIPFGESQSLKRRFEMIADANVKGQMTRGGWILLGVGLACLMLVPVRAEVDSVPTAPPIKTVNASNPFASMSNFGCPATPDENPNSESNELDQKSKARAAETREYIASFKLASNHRAKYGFSGVGNLVKSGYWIGELPIADEQAKPIIKLDDVIWGARVNSFSADIDYLEGRPADYRDYIAHSTARRSETIDHAQLMVALGLLTEPQAAYVMGRYLSGRWEELLQDMSIREWFGITESQKKALEQIADRTQRRAAPLPMLPTDPEKRKRISAKYAAIRKESNASVMEVLTPKQREMWDQLTAKRTLPAEPPDLPDLSKAEAARIKLGKHSRIFSILSANVAGKGDFLELSDEQKSLLKSLQEVARLGLFWISLGEPVDRVAQRRDAFIKNAEQVALLGILTQTQAKRVQLLVALAGGC